MSNDGRLLAAYSALGATHNKLTEVREFANALIKYEDDHAEGAETPIIRAIANDLLTIIDGDD